jgi:hypothetical protein
MPLERPNVNDVAIALSRHIWNQKDTINLALGDYGQKLHAVYDYEKSDVDAGMFPVVMLGTPDWNRRWYASGYTYVIQFNVSIYGYCVYDDTDAAAEVIRKFAAATEEIFTDPAFEYIPLDEDADPANGHSGAERYLHYHEEVPIRSGRLDYEIDDKGRPFLRSFELQWTGYLIDQLAECP